MKKLCSILVVMTMFFNYSLAQWNATGDSFTTGRVGIGTTSLSDYDIEISRNSAAAGMKVFNSLATGRSILLFGEDFGGRYGYLAYHGQNHDAGSGYTQSFQPRSTVLVGSDIGGLGFISASEIRFATGGFYDSNQKMILSTSGNLGMGTLNPVFKLDATSELSGVAAFKTNSSGNTGNISILNASNYSYGVFGVVSGNGTLNGDVYGLGYSSNANSSFTSVLNWTSTGNVGIGTSSPGSFKLAVEGKIGAREVNVTVTSPWPDYVFEKDYILLPLPELEAFIKTNRHLPDVPAETEVRQNGLSLGEMNAILLKKVEELTLHLIEQDKKIETLNRDYTELKRSNNEIMRKLAAINTTNKKVHGR